MHAPLPKRVNVGHVVVEGIVAAGPEGPGFEHKAVDGFVKATDCGLEGVERY